MLKLKSLESKLETLISEHGPEIGWWDGEVRELRPEGEGRRLRLLRLRVFVEWREKRRRTGLRRRDAALIVSKREKAHQAVNRDIYGTNVPEKEDIARVYPWAFPFDPDKWDDISQSDIISAMREVLKYVPLKEDCKMQLTLELSRPKCYHILDNLTLEAVKDVKIQELHRFVDDVSSDESIAEDAKTMLYDFANGIIDGLYVLSDFKGDAEAIIFPISRGSFGPCTDELRGVINIADNERRMQCQRFISVQHILFGLSFSRVGDNVRMLNDRPRCSGGLHSKLSMFSIYKLSRIAADRLGDKEVGLEHLVLAIFFGKQEDDPIKRVELEYGSSLFFDDNAFDPELVDCEKQHLLLFFVVALSDAKSLEYSAVFKEFLPENCFDGALVKCCGLVVMEKLHEALKCGGLRLSPIHEES
ncbi:hypothetical protein TEA_026270 [Camellia sinensis var. sinensis]|uniref:Uncharacterized protein n=1 Tax=Camellia sinensis var. sinensis TaxID=542762 RepID=A0A4S4D7N9_CAMSN|nr:hypothetical protein TEA_026270 [Camellia sinensis var. sinensis]